MDIINSYSVGVVTVGSSSINVGGFIGGIKSTVSIVMTNCCWNSSASANAVGNDGVGSPIASLSPTYGTDEDTLTDLYSKTHVVYDQGNANAWDFATPIWYEWDNRNPVFTAQIPPVLPKPIIFYSKTNGDPIIFNSRADSKPVVFYGRV